MKGVCGPNDESTWTGPLTFTTACDPIASVPYTENFDTYGVGSDAFPSCWSRPVTYTSGSVWPSIVSGNATSSPNSLRFQSAVGTPTYAVSPSFVENIHNLRVSFMLKREGASSGTIEIGVMSNPLDLNTFELVQTINPSNNNHTEYTFDLNATTLAGGNNHIALRHNSSLNNWYYWLDDFRVETIPTCLAPTNLAVIGATENSASITWTLGNSETAWNISWGTPGYTPAAAGELGNASAVMTSYLITGLTADTNYDVYVRANCGAGDLSTWSGPLNVFTGYCTPNLDCTDGDVITNVTFQEINNQTSCSSNGYGDFTTLVANVNAGVTYPISVTVGDGFSAESVSVWIDFNNNNTFDQDEFFYIGTGSDEVVNGSISIPAALADGSYRMRVRVAAVGSALATWDMSCNELQNFGETEDYTISVSQSSGYVYEDGMWTPWDPSGVATDSDNILVINGTTSLTLSTDVKNLTIMQGATLNITNVLGLYGDLIIDGDLIFVSNANGNGELGHVSGTSSIIGEATVQSYMSINRAYRMVSSAVSTITSVRANWQEGGINTNTGFGTHITGSQTGANGFDATATGNPSMFTVNEATQAFVAVSNTDQNTLGIGEPYLLFVRGDRSINLGDNTAAGETVLRAKGSLHVGPDLQAFATGAAEAFAMFGNPYQSAVDINSVFANASGNNVNTGHYYVYDPTQGTHGSYVTVDLPNALTTGTSTANQYLQPGQAAQFTTLNVGGSAVQFLESNKAPGNFTTTSATGNSLSADNMLTVQLFTAENFSNGGPTHDSFGIIFGEGLNNEVTSADARKPMNFYENLGRNHGGNFLSIERREMPMPAEVYPLYSTGYNYADYTLKMKVEGLTETVLYLDDHYTGISTLLEDGNTVYTFSVSTGDSMSIATDRFSIRTEARLDVESHDLLAGVRLFPNPLNDNTFYITAPKLNGEQISLSISDLRGRKIFEDMLDCRANTITVSVNEDIASGIYMVTMKHGGEEQTLRLVKK